MDIPYPENNDIRAGDIRFCTWGDGFDNRYLGKHVKVLTMTETGNRTIIEVEILQGGEVQSFYAEDVRHLVDREKYEIAT